MTAPAHGELIGKFVNDWRKRVVLIYAHPTDPALVVTRGTPFPAYWTGPDSDVWTTEPREYYRPWIGRFDGYYE